MTSQDNSRYVTVEMFNDGIARIERRFDALEQRFDALERRMDKMEQTMTEMRAEVRAIDRRAEINTVKIDELHHFMGTGFTVIAIVVGIVGFMLTLAPMLREMYLDRKQAKSEHIKDEILGTVRGEMQSMRGEMQSMIDVAISRALSAKQ